MSALLHPVGPESPRTYWIRRAIAVGVAVLLIVVVVRALTGKVSKSEQSPPPPVPVEATPSTSTSTLPTESPSPSSSPASSASMPSASSATKPTLPSPCNPVQVKIAVSGPDAASVTQPIELSITFTAESACVLDFATNPFELRIASGADRIWSTKDCPIPELTGMREVGANPYKVGVAWPVRRSGAGCKLAESPLRPGTYVATAELQGSSPARQVMTLR